MALNALTYIRLPDVPKVKDQGLYNYLMQLNRVFLKMSGVNDLHTRVITLQDLEDNSTYIKSLLNIS